MLLYTSELCVGKFVVNTKLWGTLNDFSYSATKMQVGKLIRFLYVDDDVTFLFVYTKFRDHRLEKQIIIMLTSL